MWQITLYSAGLAAALFGAWVLDDDQDPHASAWFAQSAPAASEAPQQLATINRAADGLFYVGANLGTGEARFLIDTGASHVILSHADAKLAKVRTDQTTSAMLYTAGGTIDVDWVIIDELKVAGVVLKDVKAAVPRRDVGLSLLGQNALVGFSGVRIKGDSLSFNR